MLFIYMVKCMKVISCAVKQPLQHSCGFQPFLPFPKSETYGGIPAHDSSGSRSTCSRRCTGELKITVDRNICVTSVHCLDSSFFCSSKVGNCTRYQSIWLLQKLRAYSYSSMLPKLWLLGLAKFSKYRKYGTT